MIGWTIAAGVLVVVVLIAVSQAAARHRLERARAAYEAALAKLEKSPSDNRCRISALEKGRAFADVAREQAGSKGRVIFDEVALSNDLNARAGVAGPEPAHMAADDWSCPDCAETVKKAARKCRFCGYVFAESAVTADA